MNTNALNWITGSDTGTSSKTIWSVMMGTRLDHSGRPYDSADFGRCYRLLKSVPEWKHRLSEVSDRYKEWIPIIREWGRIEEAYLLDIQDNGRRSYDILKSLDDECMILDGWVKTSPSSWKKENATCMNF